jgi:branched-subunit amino acid ABC-type transport system permease component
VSDLLPYIVGGLAAGSIYAVAALGLVLTYKTTGLFNFAHGSVAAAAAYVFHDLWKTHGVPWPIAFVLVIGVLAPLGGLLLERLARLLVRASTAAKIVATVGLLVGVQGVLVLHYGQVALEFPSFLPTTTHAFAGIVITVEQVVTMVVALGSAAALAVFFKRTRTGRAMRAVVDNSDLLSLTGVNPNRVRVTSWVIGSCFASLSGLLIAPSYGLDAFLLTLLVVQAFGAAAIGAFGSLPMTYVGGLVIGIGAAISRKYVGQLPALSGFPASFPFIVLFVVLLVLPTRRLTQAPDSAPRRGPARRALPPGYAAGLAVLGVAVLASVPLFGGARMPAYTSGLVYVLLFASLGLLVRTSGQVSLCHMAFAAVGAATFAHGLDAGLPWLLSLLLAGLVTVPIGALVAIPAIRLSRLYLALATLGFGILLERLVYGTGLMFGSGGTKTIARPGFASGDNAYYYVALVVVVLGLGVVYAVNQARLGRLLRALSDSPTALATLGVDVNTARLLVLCISAFLAGIAGALLGGANTSVSSINFNSFVSLLLLPVLFIAGRNQLVSPFIAAFSLAVLPSFFSGQLFTELQPILFGAAAVAVSAFEGRSAGGLRLPSAGAHPRLRHTVLQERLRRTVPSRAPRDPVEVALQG